MQVVSAEQYASPAIESARYRQVLGHFPTGVTVITAAGADGPAGMCVGSFASVSLDPPLVAFFAGKSSSSYPAIEAAGHYCVNILSDDPVTPDFQFDVEGDGSTNAPPTLALAAGGSSFTAGSDFDLAVDPGTALSQADLEVDDATPDPVDVTVAFDTGPMGATPPAGITAPANVTFTTGQLPGALSWTGTADASNDPGTYTWTVTLDDGVNTPIDFDVNITINNVAPQHTAVTGVTGDGTTAGTQYVTDMAVGSSAVIDIADATDANVTDDIDVTGQNQNAAPAGSTLAFTFSTNSSNPTILQATPNGAAVAADVGDFDYDVTISDGANNVTVFVRITVIAGTAPTITSSAGSTSMSHIGRTSITSPPSRRQRPATEWPPERTLTSSSCSRANASAAITSSTAPQLATSAGRCSIFELNRVQVSS